jgi:hypothetical protein
LAEQVGRLILNRIDESQMLFGLTKFDIIQAVTEVSQLVHVSQRLEMEDAIRSYAFSQTVRRQIYPDTLAL